MKFWWVTIPGGLRVQEAASPINSKVATSSGKAVTGVLMYPGIYLLVLRYHRQGVPVNIRIAIACRLSSTYLILLGRKVAIQRHRSSPATTEQGDIGDPLRGENGDLIAPAGSQRGVACSCIPNNSSALRLVPCSSKCSPYLCSPCAHRRVRRSDKKWPARPAEEEKTR